MTKRAVIQNITKKEFNDQYKNWSYGLKFDNGDEGFLSCKKEFHGGEEIEYEIEEATSKAGKSYNKIKLPSTGYAPRGNFGGSKGGNESFALSYSKDFHVALIAAGKTFDANAETIALSILKVAEKFKTWLDEHK